MKSNKLTIKQENFCNKYIECGIASEAYRFAYSCEKMKDKVVWSKASELLAKGKVAVRVAEIQSELKATSDITKERIIKEYSKIAFSSIAHLHKTWINLKDFEKLTDDQKDSIESIKTRKRILPGDTLIEVEEVQIKLYDKLRALDSIVKMFGFDAPTKSEVSVTMEQPLFGDTGEG